MEFNRSPGVLVRNVVRALGAGDDDGAPAPRGEHGSAHEPLLSLGMGPLCGQGI